MKVGIPSSYLYWLYPDRPCAYDHYLYLSGLSPAELELLKDGFVTFAKRVTMRDPRRLILKSPTHTARVKTLLELFPQAKFIHLVRDPPVIIHSPILTWRRLGEVAGITSQIRDDLPEYVLENFRRMDAAFESQRDLIPSENFFATRYEDLTANMITTVQQMYSHLGLGDFSAIRPHLEQYVEQQQGYRRNKFEPDAELRDRIAQSCNEYCQRYGYEG